MSQLSLSNCCPTSPIFNKALKSKPPKIKTGNEPLSTPKGATGKCAWDSAEEAGLVATLLAQKLTGNTTDTGFKPSVWSIVVVDISRIRSGTPKKTVSQCKRRYQRVSCKLRYCTAVPA